MRRAFSLLELLIVLMILATIAAVAAPRYGAAVGRYRADAAARRIQSDLLMARARAQAASAVRVVEFEPGSGAYRIPGETSLDRGGGDYAVDLGAEPYLVTDLEVSFGSDHAVAFDMYGQPDGGGSVIVRVGAEVRTVVVDGGSGQVTVP
jgi:prepilin-type N-terminal cleavage/methylation domain-containing protein